MKFRDSYAPRSISFEARPFGTQLVGTLTKFEFSVLSNDGDNRSAVISNTDARRLRDYLDTMLAIVDTPL